APERRAGARPNRSVGRLGMRPAGVASWPVLLRSYRYSEELPDAGRRIARARRIQSTQKHAKPRQRMDRTGAVGVTCAAFTAPHILASRSWCRPFRMCRVAKQTNHARDAAGATRSVVRMSGSRALPRAGAVELPGAGNSLELVQSVLGEDEAGARD